jgi:hypothetical protein
VFAYNVWSRGLCLIGDVPKKILCYLLLFTQMTNENTPPSGHQQQPSAPRLHIRNGLSQSAQATLTARNREKASNMRADISTVWVHVDKAAIDIGEKYNKNVISVQQAIGSGAAISSRRHTKVNPWCAYLHAVTEERREEGSTGGEVCLLWCMYICLNQ